MGIDLSEYIFVGLVSSIDPTHGTAVVTRPDRDGRTTAPLSVLQRGAKDTKDFWMPAIDDQVLCVLLPDSSGKGPSMGWIVGACYSDIDTVPAGASGSTRVLSHPGDMTMRIGGTLTIEAGTLDIRGGGDVVASGISLTGHVHGGVQSGGSTTSGPQ